jgi:hypothetical protein
MPSIALQSRNLPTAYKLLIRKAKPEQSRAGSGIKHWGVGSNYLLGSE